ncbi:MAG: hypothetical protein IJV27_12290 [Prevotella sp.]|nr:hypothetical protein [Prevotella sp.]
MDRRRVADGPEDYGERTGSVRRKNCKEVAIAMPRTKNFARNDGGIERKGVTLQAYEGWQDGSLSYLGGRLRGKRVTAGQQTSGSWAANEW